MDRYSGDELPACLCQGEERDRQARTEVSRFPIGRFWQTKPLSLRVCLFLPNTYPEDGDCPDPRPRVGVCPRLSL
jgi:hypothetical protein